MPTPLLWIVTIAWMAAIFFLGASAFGRAGTQGWIDRLRSHPRLHAWLDRHHGKFRAAFHYVEFTTLTWLLYWALGRGDWGWADARAALAYALSCGYAYVDEWHQSRTPGRQFRPVDFIHSLLGATLAVGVLYWGDILRQR